VGSGPLLPPPPGLLLPSYTAGGMAWSSHVASPKYIFIFKKNKEAIIICGGVMACFDGLFSYQLGMYQVFVTQKGN